jgi:luciferase family oxidoreductase group 1
VLGLKLSILDQSPINEGETATDAFQHTIEIAKAAEKLGYYRFWVSEHHDSEGIAGSSPEVLISHLLAKTERIRIGSGGVMLQHYSPYKVAENFNVLASLAPGRVDLGIGRAPGGLPRSTKALQQDTSSQRPLSEKLIELDQLIHNRLNPEHELQGLKATPVPAEPASIYLLGASTSSAELAASLGIPYVYAQFLNSDEAVINAAFEAYHKLFDIEKSVKPQAILAIGVIVADTDEEAKQLASDNKLIKVHLASGKSVTVKTIEQAEEFARQAGESYTLEEKIADIIHGSKETVRNKLLDIQKKYAIDELIVTAYVKGFQQRINSYTLLKEAFSVIETK